jgi:hypothetical protein
VFKRRAQDPELAAARETFNAVADRIDVAQRALLAAIPTARDPGVPIAQALKAFGAALDDASVAMEGWRDARRNEHRDRCASALKEARDQAEQLRLHAGDLDFEQLNARVGDVLYPLETFAEVERKLRKR